MIEFPQFITYWPFWIFSLIGMAWIAWNFMRIILTAAFVGLIIGVIYSGFLDSTFDSLDDIGSNSRALVQEVKDYAIQEIRR